ncbi:XRE family transcriptional regulator [Caballeronia peredens]|nr:XRE family transcriptional regulator [Caballeronia peredens]
MDNWNKRIASRRQEVGLSKSEFARRCDVSAPTVNDWENGDIKRLEASNLLKICQVLDVDPWWLMFGDKTKTPNTKELRPVSDEAERLIQCAIRFDGLGEVARRSFTLHAGLLLLSLSNEESGYSADTSSLLDQAESEAEELLSNVPYPEGKNAPKIRRRS